MIMRRSGLVAVNTLGSWLSPYSDLNATVGSNAPAIHWRGGNLAAHNGAPTPTLWQPSGSG
jgi:hypothetical protein